MADNKNYEEPMERVMNQLAESVLDLSDEDIVAEVSESGIDPEQEADRTRLVLRQTLEAFENVNTRLFNLGHTINARYWWRGRDGYHNNCLTCGSLVSLNTANSEMQGDALDVPCPETDHAIRMREASGK